MTPRLLRALDAASVAAWLQAPPTVEVIARDRSALYAAGAAAGAPQAVQVADRWHIIKNLVEAREKLFLRKRRVLAAAAAPPVPPNPPRRPRSRGI